MDDQTGVLLDCPLVEGVDHGDVGLPAGYDRSGQLLGLDPSDTIAEYADSHGQKKITCSNRICLCVPRYILTRGETVPAGQLALVERRRDRAERIRR